MVTPLGAEKSHHADVRLIAATHRDLKQLVAEGRFREDLYYRLAAYEIRVPPLRERRSDIPLLVDHFRRKVAQEMHRDGMPGPSQALLDLFDAHQWPGNVRELEQVIRRTVIDSGGLTDAQAARNALRAIAPNRGGQAPSPGAASDDAGLSATPDENGEDLLFPLDEAERRHILAVLRATGGNQTQAAFILGIERKTLARKIKRFAINLEESS
jgi:DNA-binding NtrC family response regulator